ncbi:hypothetical protein GIB67_011370, partial [Kingdonia uniflora]
DPYINKRDSAHAFKEFTFFYGVLASPDHVQPYYPNRVVQQFNREQGIPGKRLITEDFVLKKADRGWRVREGPLVCTEGYLEWFASFSWTTICPITVDLAADDDARVHQRKEATVNEHGDTPVRHSQDVAEQYDVSTSECDLLKETIKQIKAEIELNRVVDEQCALEFADLQSLVTLLLCSCFEQLAILPSHQPVPDTTLAKKYEDLLAAHEDIKKKLIAKKDFRQKLVNAEERMKSLEAINSEW